MAGVSLGLLGVLLACRLLAAPAPRAPVLVTSAPAPARATGTDNCLTCHFGIEEMHPWEPLSCTDCHGGDGRAETKEEAHVAPSRPMPNDERVLPLDFDLDYLRFKNPSNLRVVDRTCGTCHAAACGDLARSLHGTTAGHLCDGMYECGILASRGSKYGMFLVGADADLAGEAPPGVPTLEQLYALPGFDGKKPRDEFGTHYRDLPPKNCVRCHLWAPGVAVRGRLGMDGDYRSEGCAACHVTYANDGLSKGGDPTVDRFEPGHAVRHELTSRIPTDTCTHCHYGDASIGLNFRGLAQLYPGQPAGPDVPGTTDSRLNQTFYIDDDAVTPPDVHHERGMHCIDCHTVKDVMGDGQLYGQMPAAIEIECVDCHGTVTSTTNFRTSRGRPIENLKKDGGRFVLVSKVTGKEHPVKQAMHVVNPRHADYNPKAAKAMTAEHERLECYTCHGSWSPNFFGFHFDRHEQFTQLDLMTGERTPGRVNTQEKVFATFRGLYLGWNSEGMIAPYMVGFSSMGSVYDAKGEVVFDQRMPVTAAGLSGMTMIHHQLHTTRKQGRGCADCHRNPTALGLGSPNANFALARNFIFVGSSRGLDVLALDRKQVTDTVPVATLPIFGVTNVALDVEPLQGFARRAYLSVARRGIAVVDLENAAFPREVGFVEADDPRASVVAANRLYVADGKGGLKTFDVTDRERPRLLSSLPLSDARDLALNWPHVFIADHEQGLVIVDVSRPETPVVRGIADLDRDEEGPAEAVDVAMLVIPSRPENGAGMGERSPTQILAGVACSSQGLRVVDVTDPEKPFVYPNFGLLGRQRTEGLRTTSVAAISKVDLGSPDGGIPTQENDYFVATTVTADRTQGRLSLVQATRPYQPKLVDSESIHPFAEDISVVNVFNPPFLQQFVLIAAGNQFQIAEITKSDGIELIASFAGLRGAGSVAVEAMPLDRLVDEAGSPWKDISHDGARFFSRAEIDKILRAPILRSFEQIGPTTPAAKQGKSEK